jgi:hypothetical protein
MQVGKSPPISSCSLIGSPQRQLKRGRPRVPTSQRPRKSSNALVSVRRRLKAMNYCQQKEGKQEAGRRRATLIMKPSNSTRRRRFECAAMIILVATSSCRSTNFRWSLSRNDTLDLYAFWRTYEVHLETAGHAAQKRSREVGPHVFALGRQDKAQACACSGL